MSPGRIRRRVPRAGVALAAAVVLTGCGTVEKSSDVLPSIVEASPTPGTSGAPAALASVAKPGTLPGLVPLPTSTGTPVPLAPARGPADFAGNDEQYVRQVRENLDEEKAKDTFSDSRLVTLGREFCSVLSGGGLLTEKVDYWAGLRGLGKGSDVAIILAAQEIFCADLTDGFTRLELEEDVPEASAAEKADLARFVTALDEPKLTENLKSLPDERIAQDAETACDISFHDEWWSRSKAKRVAEALPDGAQLDYVVALVTAYCPKEADEMIDALEDYAD